MFLPHGSKVNRKHFTATSPGHANLDQYSSTPSTAGICASHIHDSAKLLRSTNDHGKWKVIVHLPETSQISHLETCDRYVLIYNEWADGQTDQREGRQLISQSGS